ncbi:MAG: peptidylprolyl isomerase [Proteobacteria bacterium]|nr:peptidylprolyl isomerase [Pseudomonadota bacterium]
MKKSKKILCVLVFFSMVFGCSNKATSKEATENTAQKEGKVVIKIGDGGITDKEIKEEFELLPDQLKALVNTKEGKKQFIDSLVTREIIYHEAKSKGFDKNEKVLQDLEKLKKRLIIEAYLREAIKFDEKVEDKVLKDFYKKHEKEFVGPERIHAKHILVKDKKLADEILEKLKKDPGMFEKLAQEHSIDSSGKNGGDLGFLEKGTLVPEFEEALDKMKKENEISPVIKTDYGYHIIKFIKREKGNVPNFEEVKEEVKEMYLKENQRAIFDKVVGELKNKYKIEFKEEDLNALFNANKK